MEEEEEEEKEKERYRNMKCRKLFQDFGAKKADKHTEKKVSERRRRQTKVRSTLKKCGECFFFSC